MKRLKELRAKQEDGTITDAEKTELETLEDANEGETEETTEVEVPAETLEAAAEKGAQKAIDKMNAAEKVIVKNISVGGARTVGAKVEGEEVSKEVRLVRWLKGAMSGAAAHDVELKVEIGQNEGSVATGGALVPPAELIAEIMRLDETFGVSLRDCNVRRNIIGNAFTIIVKTAGVTMYDLNEEDKIPVANFTVNSHTITMGKRAVIVPVTSELEEDSAVDIWNAVTYEIALAYAVRADKLVFTDATTGITNIGGTNKVVVGTTINDITYDHISEAIYGVPMPAMLGGKFYMHRTIVGVVTRIKDSFGRPIFVDSPTQGGAPTLLGYPVEFTEVMPALSADATNVGFIVFGNLKYFDFGIKRELQLTMLQEGTIGSTNLAEQDMRALRATTRFNGQATFTNAFSVIFTGTVS